MRLINNLGIISTYIFMLIACYVFEWEAFGIFISYLIELIIMLFVYVYVRWRDEKKRPRAYRKFQPPISIVIGIAPLLLFQLFMIGWTSTKLSSEDNFLLENLIYTKEVLYAASSMLVFYIVKVLSIQGLENKEEQFRNSFIFKAIALTVTNGIGFFLVTQFEFISLLPVLTAMVAARIGLEFYFSKRMKFL